MGEILTTRLKSLYSRNKIPYKNCIASVANHNNLKEKRNHHQWNDKVQGQSYPPVSQAPNVARNCRYEVYASLRPLVGKVSECNNLWRGGRMREEGSWPVKKPLKPAVRAKKMSHAYGDHDGPKNVPNPNNMYTFSHHIVLRGEVMHISIRCDRGCFESSVDNLLRWEAEVGLRLGSREVDRMTTDNLRTRRLWNNQLREVKHDLTFPRWIREVEKACNHE